jgi:hypothetical protein
MSHAAGSGSPRAHIFAFIICPPDPSSVTVTLILYHFLVDIRPTPGASVYDPAGPFDPQKGGGTVPPHTEINKYAGLSSIEAVTPMDLAFVPVW